MRMTVEVTLDKSRQEVWKAFDSPANMRKWQPTLKSFEPVSGTPGQVGAVSRLTYDENGRSIVLTETITLRQELVAFAGMYDSGHAVNTVQNSFTEVAPGRTKWVMEADLLFRGFLKLMAPFIRGTIEKRMRTDVERFKTLLEAGELAA